jgi:hypothetical protein
MEEDLVGMDEEGGHGEEHPQHAPAPVPDPLLPELFPAQGRE